MTPASCRRTSSPTRRGLIRSSGPAAGLGQARATPTRRSSFEISGSSSRRSWLSNDSDHAEYLSPMWQGGEYSRGMAGWWRRYHGRPGVSPADASEQARGLLADEQAAL